MTCGTWPGCLQSSEFQVCLLARQEDEDAVLPLTGDTCRLVPMAALRVSFPRPRGVSPETLLRTGVLLPC